MLSLHFSSAETRKFFLTTYYTSTNYGVYDLKYSIFANNFVRISLHLDQHNLFLKKKKLSQWKTIL